MEPERKIEKLLRAFGKKRRDDAGAPLELHPATRRMLQGEVARRAPKRSEENSNPFLALLSALRPRMAFIVPVAMIGLIVAVLILPALTRTKSRSMAMRGKNESFEEERADKQAAVPAETASRERDLQKDLNGAARGVRVEESAKLETADEKKNQPGAEATAQFADNLRQQPAAVPVSKVDVDRFSTNSATIAAAKGNIQSETAAMTGVDQPARVDFVEAGAFGGRAGGGGGGGGGGAPIDLAKRSAVRFSRVQEETPRMPAAPAQPPVARTFADTSNATTNLVLNSFAVEQNGRELRIVDQDGSIYSGYFQLPNPPPSRSRAPVGAARPGAVMDAETVALTETCSFQVSGTNRSLQQNVVFTGSLSATNGVLFQWGTNGAIGGGAAPSNAGNFPQLQLTNSHMSGSVSIGNSRQVEIRAAPAGR